MIDTEPATDELPDSVNLLFPLPRLMIKLPPTVFDVADDTDRDTVSLPVSAVIAKSVAMSRSVAFSVLLPEPRSTLNLFAVAPLIVTVSLPVPAMTFTAPVAFAPAAAVSPEIVSLSSPVPRSVVKLAAVVSFRVT